MTSNLASTEIADHAMDLRREAEVFAKERNEGKNDDDDDDLEEKITISRQFKV